MRRFIEGLPKAELHLHIEGTLEPELKFSLAERNGVALPAATIEEMRAAYDFDDLPSFLAVYYEGMSVLLTEEDFYDLTYAYLEKAHSQNVLYAEIFFDPQAHTTRGVRFQTVISGIRRAQEEARSALGIDTQLIMCFLRDLSADSAAHTLEAAADFQDWIVGVGLDSDEHGNPPVKFREVFAAAREMGYRLTMHCDVDQENSVGNIRQCLDEIGVDRIDHGVNAGEDDELVAELVRRDMALTVCPISNRYVTDGTKAAQIKDLLDRGVRVTVNSDDPAYFPGYIFENLVVLQEEAGLSRKDLVRLSRNAFGAAWLDDDRKAGFLESLDAFVAAGQD
ncbi:MAG: adenosine deaminase [Acidimicrobiia bacterium]|nr:adenosine deaminase [Acidimicrobiia bacterium]NNL68585.1 adenosine deaminase [Acidimicrobiia bacterium]